jgi:hypothetical protein
LKKGIALLLPAAAIFCFFCNSCATLAIDRVKDLKEFADPKKAYIVMRFYSDPEIIGNAYFSLRSATFGNPMNIKSYSSDVPIVYSIKPGTYRVSSITATQKKDFASILANNKPSYIYEKPYYVKFFFSLSPGQVIYLGDFNASYRLFYDYDLSKIKEELAKVQPNVEGFDWIDYYKETPDWATRESAN